MIKASKKMKVLEKHKEKFTDPKSSYRALAGIHHAEDGTVYATDRHGDVPVLSAVATCDPDSDEVVVFAVNRAEQPVELNLALLAGDGYVHAEHVTLTGGRDAVNTPEQPDRVSPRRLDTSPMDGGRAVIELPAVSWNALRFTPHEKG